MSKDLDEGLGCGCFLVLAALDFATHLTLENLELSRSIKDARKRLRT